MTEVSQESKDKAEVLKSEGNEWIKLVKYQNAIDSYTEALTYHRTAVILSNRALAYTKAELPGAALVDANEAIEIDPHYIKAYYRKATAHLEQGKVKEAMADFKRVLTLVPGDIDATSKYEQCQKEVRRVAFAAAIASEDSVPLSVQLDEDKIPIPPSYKGPLVSNKNITEEYILEMIETFRKQELICRRDLVWLLKEVLKIFNVAQNIVHVSVPDDQEITVCGDTHGQYYDTLNIFKINGNPSATNRYIFNGDFVDRGSYSFENVTMLLAFKLLYPEYFFMSRGNHEGQAMNRVYGFEGEVRAKYDDKIVGLFAEVFNALPTGHIINNKVFVVHGGLYSKDNVKIEDIQKLNRFREIPEEGLLCESLWSDPQPMGGRGTSKRGVGCSFGPTVTDNFLKTNDLSLVVRSHEVKDDGYVVEHDGKCITVFSAPNYCDQIGNKGAFIRFKGKDMIPKFTQFTHVTHPGKRPMAYASAFQGMI
eukprot:Tbor_TRINITY_DN5733_c4_g2::TRINITY_DN5733_c4_g2_i3::g.19892::m.19892/K04460/PPP5C; serine/threonine-protein phosphatase 5